MKQITKEYIDGYTYNWLSTDCYNYRHSLIWRITLHLAYITQNEQCQLADY